MYSQTQKEKVDAAEHFLLSPVALLKMLKHARAGIPLEVMGLMLGEYINSYTINIVDVFAMPQSGTGTTVEAIDPAFQTEMLDCLEKTGRTEHVIGWYHSHPGFGCWLSQTDCSTQQEFEKLNERCLAVVVDPVQSVKGNVVLEAFRTMPGMMGMGGDSDITQSTSNKTYLNKPSVAAIIHGLNRNYYTVRGEYNVDFLELKMLLNLEKKGWNSYLEIPNYDFKEFENILKEKLQLYNDSLTSKRASKKIEEEVNENANEYIKELLDKKKEENTNEEKKIGRIDNKINLREYSDKILKKCTLHKLLVNIHKEILNF